MQVGIRRRRRKFRQPIRQLTAAHQRPASRKDDAAPRRVVPLDANRRNAHAPRGALSDLLRIPGRKAIYIVRRDAPQLRQNREMRTQRAQRREEVPVRLVFDVLLNLFLVAFDRERIAHLHAFARVVYFVDLFHIRLVFRFVFNVRKSGLSLSRSYYRACGRVHRFAP